jgi:hypothetical protein
MSHGGGGVSGAGHGHGAHGAHGVHGAGAGHHAGGAKKASLDHSTGKVTGNWHGQCQGHAQIPHSHAGQAFMAAAKSANASNGHWDLAFSRRHGIAVGADNPNQPPTLIISIGGDDQIAFVFGKDEAYQMKGHNHGQAHQIGGAHSHHGQGHGHHGGHKVGHGGHGHGHGGVGHGGGGKH